ncbi:MAG TPA: hypothetical protein PK358_08060 [Spirochaetota bacterium]|nr:hypothetical protein [Spirochaetota bacterium]
MDKDKFDLKMIDIEQKFFELGMLMSVFAFEILEQFDNGTAVISVLLDIVTNEGESVEIETEQVSLDRETGEIKIKCANLDDNLVWEDLDLSAKNAVINELHFRYKSDRLYDGLSGDGEIH